MEEPRTEGPTPFNADVLRGILLALGLHLVVGLLVFFVVPEFLDLEWYIVAVSCFGLSQFLYIGPLMLYARKLKRPGLFRGLLLVAALTFLVNAGCWGLIATSGL